MNTPPQKHKKGVIHASLKPLGPGSPYVLKEGPNYLGRGPVLGITDNRCSRQQLRIDFGPEIIVLKACGVNPISIKHQEQVIVLKKDEERQLSSGDVVYFLGKDLYPFEIVLVTEDAQQKATNDFATNNTAQKDTWMKKKRKRYDHTQENRAPLDGDGSGEKDKGSQNNGSIEKKHHEESVVQSFEKIESKVEIEPEEKRDHSSIQLRGMKTNFKSSDYLISKPSIDKTMRDAKKSDEIEKEQPKLATLVRQESLNDIEKIKGLRNMFGDLEEALILNCLKENEGNVERTIDSLLTLNVMPQLAEESSQPDPPKRKRRKSK